MSVEIDVRANVIQAMSQERQSFKAGDLQRRLNSQAFSSSFGDQSPVVVGVINPLTGTPRRVSVASFQALADATHDALIQQALLAVQAISQGFTDSGQKPDFYPDVFLPKTSGNTFVVNLHQRYRGIEVFQMMETVRFSSRGLEIVGDHAILSDIEKSVVPSLTAAQAATIAINHLAANLNGHTAHSHWGPSSVEFNFDVSQVDPKVVAVFPMPNRPTVLETQPFDSPIAAHLVWFYAGKNHHHKDQLHLGWFLDITTPGFTAQYHVIVGAGEDQESNILFAIEASRSATQGQSAAQVNSVSGNVYVENPGPNNTVDTRKLIRFPRPVNDYPLPRAIIPLPADFPFPWINSDETLGKATDGRVVVSEFPRTEMRVKGTRNGNDVAFDIASGDRFGADQQGLNVFYFCNYMHDFFYILGFREADGNFSGNDPVVAFSHPRAVFGTANMLTRVDGLSPTMNMGLVEGGINRHTAFDADVVFHEFLHGVTNRLVGGANNVNSLDEVQSRMQGEGWGDYFALTIQNFGQVSERTTPGDWVTMSPNRGIRRFPFNDGYREDFGNIKPGGSTQVHAGGEIWCATLMHMTRLMGKELGDQKRGYQVAWQIVVDALKLVPANPSFLDSRDGILDALDDLQNIGFLVSLDRDLCRRAIWTAFAGFGMGPNATCLGASIFGVQTDFKVPNEPGIGLNGVLVNRPRDTSLQPNPLTNSWAARSIDDKHSGAQLSIEKRIESLPKDRKNTLLAIIDAYLSHQS